MTDQASWANPLYDYLVDEGVTLFTYVPDAGHKVMILRSLADRRVRSIPLTTEEEGVAMAAGAHLGGGKAVLLMQSSGTGNCINMLSLIKHGRFPFLTFVTMRGDFGEENPWQIAMGQAVQPALESIGVICLRVERPDEVLMTASAAMGMAYKSQCGVAVLLSQRLIGAKGF
jgi:sulfopyruvate decarboxylase alpha subunit